MLIQELKTEKANTELLRLCFAYNYYVVVVE